MGIAQDTAIDYNNKIVEVKKNRYTVNQLYSYLMETFDESTQMDDLIPMNAKTPTLYELVNGWVVSTLSWDFLYNSAVTETRNNTQNWNVWTNIRSLGAIEAETRLYIQQGTLVTYHSYWPFCLLNTLLPTDGTLVVSATIPASVSASGSLVIDVWSQTNPKETIAFTSWENGTSSGTFYISNPSSTHDVNDVVYAPHIGHFDICLQTVQDYGAIDGQTFKTYCRKFQKTYSDFTTTGGAFVSNVPVASAADPFLTLPVNSLSPWSNSITIEWQTSNIKRSAFDGTVNVQEYALQNSIPSSGTYPVTTSTTIAAAVPASGYLQVESEVMHYGSWENGAYGTFNVDGRGTFDTAAAGHLAGRDLSTAMFEYDILVQATALFPLISMYNWIQWQLLLQEDIADDATVHYGWITNPLVEYTGMLWTKQGVWVEGFSSADRSNIRYRDVNNLLHTPPTYILLKIDAETAMSGGRGAMYRLSAAYDPTNYTIVSTLIDAVLDGDGNAETTIKYVDPWYVLVRTRKAGRIPYETGAQITSAGLTILATNPQDTIYNPT